MPPLKEGAVYAIDGGFFTAHYNQEQQQFELWTWQGLAGYMIGRTGFVVESDGRLLDRVFDLEQETMDVIDRCGYTMADLEEVEPGALMN